MSARAGRTQSIQWKSNVNVHISMAAYRITAVTPKPGNFNESHRRYLII